MLLLLNQFCVLQKCSLIYVHLRSHDLDAIGPTDGAEELSKFPILGVVLNPPWLHRRVEGFVGNKISVACSNDWRRSHEFAGLSVHPTWIGLSLAGCKGTAIRWPLRCLGCDFWTDDNEPDLVVDVRCLERGATASIGPPGSIKLLRNKLPTPFVAVYYNLFSVTIPDLAVVKAYYQVLEVRPGCSVADLKEAFRDQMRIWHPDRFPPSTPDRVRSRAQERAKRINEAFEFLKENHGRYTPEMFADDQPDEENGRDLKAALASARAEAAKVKEQRDAAQRKGRAERHARQRAEKIAREAEAKAHEAEQSLLEIERRANQSREEAERLKLDLAEAERWRDYWNQRPAERQVSNRWRSLKSLWSDSRRCLWALAAAAVVSVIVLLLPPNARQFLFIMGAAVGISTVVVYYILNRR